jgi:hypothetical protein
MQFLFQGNTIRVIRTTQDEKTGKAKPVGIGRLNRAKPQINEKLRSACTAAELVEVQAWIQRQQSVAQLKEEYAAESLAEQMALAAQWFKTVEPADARQAADDIRAAWAALRRTISKATKA